MTNTTGVTVQELAKRLEGGTIEILDVRTPIEYRTRHIAESQNVPMANLTPQKVMDDREQDSEQPLYVICEKGGRSLKACQAFLDAGHTNVINVEGGTLAWELAGFALTREANVVSLERQVRIAAGLLVLLGAGLSFLNPYFLGISIFVGTGLIFAGITDTCGMAMLLANMPWNRESR